MPRSPQLAVVGDADDIAIDFASRPPLVPDRQYNAVFVKHETAMVFNTGKVFVWFRLVDVGEQFGVELYRVYRVSRLLSRPGAGGRFKLKPSGDMFATLCRLLDVRARPDRISLRGLRGRVWRVRSRTVRTDNRQRVLPEWMRYSVIDDILGDAQGGALPPSSTNDL